MTGIIVHINGWPGVGKYTVGKIVAERLGARFAPNHSLCAPANCIADFGTPIFFEMAGKVRALVFEQMIKAPLEERFIMTSVLSDGDDDAARFEKIRDIAEQRGHPLLAVSLVCDADENERRLSTPFRAARRSLTDGTILRSLFRDYQLLQPSHDPTLELDTTETSPEQNAQVIVDFVERLAP